MRAEIKLTDVKDIRDLHEYINAELRLRRVAPTLEALQAALEMPKTEAEIEFTDYGKISGALLDYVNKMPIKLRAVRKTEKSHPVFLHGSSFFDKKTHKYIDFC